jgi:hypothetical protein
MQSLKAHVENGRLKLDEATDLPEGKVIELVPLDDVFLNGGDSLSDEERTALHRELLSCRSGSRSTHRLRPGPC